MLGEARNRRIMLIACSHISLRKCSSSYIYIYIYVEGAFRVHLVDILVFDVFSHIFVIIMSIAIFGNYILLVIGFISDYCTHYYYCVLIVLSNHYCASILLISIVFLGLLILLIIIIFRVLFVFLVLLVLLILVVIISIIVLFVLLVFLVLLNIGVYHLILLILILLIIMIFVLLVFFLLLPSFCLLVIQLIPLGRCPLSCSSFSSFDYWNDSSCSFAIVPCLSGFWFLWLLIAHLLMAPICEGSITFFLLLYE